MQSLNCFNYVINIINFLIPAFILSISFVHGTGEYISIASGRTLPKKIIFDRFRRSSIESALRRLYEITPQYRIVGHGLNISILDVTDESERVIVSSPKLVLKNGILSDNIHGEVYIRMGTKFQAGHSSDGTILGFWGPNIALQPLDLNNHPGIYIDTFSTNAKTVAVGTDQIYDSRKENNSYNESESVSAFGSSSSIDLNGQTEFTVIESGSSSTTDETIVSRSKRSNVFTTFSSIINVSAKQQIAACVAGKINRELKLAVAFSYKLCEAYGSFEKTQQAILTSVATASKAYETATCLKITVTSYDGYCLRSKDPYKDYHTSYGGSEKRQKKMLEDFSNFWSNSRQSIERDLAYFFPSFTDSIPIIGMAYLRGVCSKSTGYGWIEGLYPIVLAHEIGHNFNAVHSKSGLMTRSVNPRAKNFVFSKGSSKIIRTYAKQSFCLTELPNNNSPPTTGPPSTTSTTISNTKSQQPPPPSPPPPPSTGTCGEKFNTQLGFRCSKGDLPSIRSETSTLFITCTVKLQNDQFIVISVLKSTRKGTKFRYRNVLVHVSTDDSYSTIQDLTKVAPIEEITNNRAKLKRSFSASALKAPTTWVSCCNRPVFIYIAVEIEQYKPSGTDTTEIAAVRLSWNMNCKVCKKTIIPMSKSRTCEKCAK